MFLSRWARGKLCLIHSSRGQASLTCSLWQSDPEEQVCHHLLERTSDSKWENPQGGKERPHREVSSELGPNREQRTLPGQVQALKLPAATPYPMLKGEAHGRGVLAPTRCPRMSCDGPSAKGILKKSPHQESGRKTRLLCFAPPTSPVHTDLNRKAADYQAFCLR